MIRENTKNNGSYYTQHNLTPPKTPYPAYSPQNIIRDLAPWSTTLTAGCDINAWWDCEASNAYGKTFWETIDANSTYLNSGVYKLLMLSSYVPMISFEWEKKTDVYSAPWLKIRSWGYGGPHKVAVSGSQNEAYDLKINDVGSGTQRKATINLKTATTTVAGGVWTVENLPGGAATLPYLAFSDDTSIKFIEENDYITLY